VHRVRSKDARPNINFDSSCPKCNADLHSCRQCTHFDPGGAPRCNKPIPRTDSEQTRAQRVRTVRDSNCRRTPKLRQALPRVPVTRSQNYLRSEMSRMFADTYFKSGLVLHQSVQRNREDRVRSAIAILNQRLNCSYSLTDATSAASSNFGPSRPVQS